MSALAETLVQGRTGRSEALAKVAFAVAGSLLVAGLAQITIRLPFTPVPITGQTLGALLVGGALGARLGGLSFALYLAEGAIGLPFYAEGAHGLSVLGAASATGGYLWGMLVATVVVGWLADKKWDRGFGSAIGQMFVGEIFVYLFGVAWLAAALDLSGQQALEAGLYPFLLGDVIKLLIAAGLLPGTWKLIKDRR